MELFRIIVTGGTIDAEDYDFSEGKVMTFGNPAVEKIFKAGRVRKILTKTTTPIDEDADIFVLEQKDSSDMTDDDRMRILLICLLDTRRHILITHGTDTMVKTGLLLAHHVEGKTIILTGAMRPHSAEETDASFNLGGALIACQTLPHGIYIVMHGQVFPIDQVRKIKEAGNAYFQEVRYVDTTKDREQQALRILTKNLKTQATILNRGNLVVEQIPLIAQMSLEGEEITGAKEAFYTAGYPPGSDERYLGPMNHTYMYVLDGAPFDLSGDLFLETGNPILGLKPRVLQIVQRGLNDKWMVIVGYELDGLNSLRVLFKTGIFQDFSSDQWMRGIVLHTKDRLLRHIWNIVKRRSSQKDTAQ